MAPLVVGSRVSVGWGYELVGPAFVGLRDSCERHETGLVVEEVVGSRTFAEQESLPVDSVFAELVYSSEQ